MPDPVRTLAIATATAACSVALLEGDRVVARAHEVVNRGHAERLLPMIAALPGGGRADAVLVDCGPGSFTGVRVGLAAARGLGLGWDVPVAGCSSLALVAAAAQGARPGPLAVVLEGGHGEVFVQAFDADLRALTPFASLRPDAALERLRHLPLVGSGVARLLAIETGLDAREALPDASDARLLPPALRDLPPSPLYGRAPDARPSHPGPSAPRA